MNNKKYGIEGFDAPELEKFKWIDANGKDTEPIQLSNTKSPSLVYVLKESLLFCIVFKVGVLAVIK